VSWILPATSNEAPRRPIDHDVRMSSRASSGSSGPKPRTSLQISSSRSSCSAIDSTKFLMVTISWTMSRISSRALSASSLDSGGEIDRLDQRAEDQRLGLKIGFPIFVRPWTGAAGAGGALGCSLATPPAATRGPTIWVLPPPLGTLAEHRSESSALAQQRRSRDVFASRSFLLAPEFGDQRLKHTSLGLRVSVRPASVEARSTKICAILPFGSISAIICPLLAAAPNSSRRAK